MCRIYTDSPICSERRKGPERELAKIGKDRMRAALPKYNLPPNENSVGSCRRADSRNLCFLVARVGQLVGEAEVVAGEAWEVSAR